MSEECDGSGGEDEALGQVADRDLADLRVAVAAGHGDEQGAVHVTDAHRPGGGVPWARMSANFTAGGHSRAFSTRPFERVTWMPRSLAGAT